MPTAAPVSSPARPGPGRASALPRDPGRATEALYRRHGKTVFRYAWHVLGSREDAEDATQATFLAVHGALARGTAVLEPGAWVLGIARNECTGRLRTTARRPVPRLLGDELTAAAGGSVESAAEVRDELRIARQTLRALPEQERDAFLLREWVGLATPDVALALGVESGYVEYLTARARRSLVIAVGGLEAPVGCAETRAGLEASSLGRAAKVHLLRCPVCRGVRRALRPRSAVPATAPAVAERLAGVLPGFGAGGGGLIVALATKATAAPVMTKAAALVAATLLAGGAVEDAIRTSHPTHHRSAAVALGRGGHSSPPVATHAGSGRSAVLAAASGSPPGHARTAAAGALAVMITPAGHASRGGAAAERHDEAAHHGARHSGASGAQRDDGGRVSASGERRGGGDNGDGSGSGERTNAGDGAHAFAKSGRTAGGDWQPSEAASSDHSGSNDGLAARKGHAAAGDGSGTTADAAGGDSPADDGGGTSSDEPGGDWHTASATDGGSDGAATTSPSAGQPDPVPAAAPLEPAATTVGG
ncbi:MAG: hypothetical protein QOK36_1173 [Gaiellales bacterium]|nr:hypothetical protein [Gaiellales bacterium]